MDVSTLLNDLILGVVQLMSLLFFYCFHKFVLELTSYKITHLHYAILYLIVFLNLRYVIVFIYDNNMIFLHLKSCVQPLLSTSSNKITL